MGRLEPRTVRATAASATCRPTFAKRGARNDSPASRRLQIRAAHAAGCERALLRHESSVLGIASVHDRAIRRGAFQAGGQRSGEGSGGCRVGDDGGEADMRTTSGRFMKGVRSSPATEFKKGQHWRPHAPHREAPWLREQYVDRGLSVGDIARACGVTDNAIDYWMRKHGIARRSTSEARALKHWGVSGKRNPMFGKRGAETPAWRGGHTPERQAFHGSAEWRCASLQVWRRDAGACRRCGLRANDCKTLFDVHHIAPFAVKRLRTELTNLVLLCRACHRFVHSKKNINHEFQLSPD